MKLEYFLYLLEINKTLSFNKASRNLNLTHQTISTGITNLENELGIQLVTRDNSGVQLTAAGLEALNFAEEITQSIKTLQQKMNEYKICPSKTGMITLGVAPLANVFILPLIIQNFALKYPSVKLNLLELDIPDIFSALEEEKIDMGIFSNLSVINKNIPQVQSFSSQTIQLCGVVTKTHPLANKKNISKQMLCTYPIALYQCNDSISFLEKSLQRFGDLNICFTTNNIATYKSYLTSGKALGILPFFKNNTILNCVENLNSLIFIPIKDINSYHLGYIFANNISSQQKHLCTLLINEVQLIL